MIDRIDLDAAGRARIIDYKAGTHDLDRDALVEGRRLQLALYAVAAEQSLGGQRSRWLYWAIQKAEAGSLRLAKFHHQDAEHVYVGAQGAIALAMET